MNDPMKKVKPGDPLVIPAATFNTFVDTARDLLTRQHQQAQADTTASTWSVYFRERLLFR